MSSVIQSRGKRKIIVRMICIFQTFKMMMMMRIKYLKETVSLKKLSCMINNPKNLLTYSQVEIKHNLLLGSIVKWVEAVIPRVKVVLEKEKEY